MQIIRKEGEEWEIADRRVVQAAEEGVSPICTKLVLEVMDDSTIAKESRNKLVNLMAMAVGVLGSQASLQQEGVIFSVLKKHQVDVFWKSGGYLESSLKVLAKCDSLELKITEFKADHPSEAEVFKRVSERVSESE